MGAPGAPSQNVNWNALIGLYSTMSSSVATQSASLGSSSNISTGVSMSALFSLQLAMNNLSMFGQTLTNVIQGVQEVAMGIARNAKGS